MERWPESKEGDSMIVKFVVLWLLLAVLAYCGMVLLSKHNQNKHW